jgi:hypothetical protein
MQTRVDLLFVTTKKPRRLISMELQSANDWLLPLRMAEYSLRVYRLHKQFPEQYVLYVGSDPMRMQSALVGPQHVCRYKIVDIRSLHAEILVDSPFHADAVMAILARYAERPETIRRILDRVVRSKGGESTAFSKVLLLAGIRGLKKGLREGSQMGRREEALLILRRQIAARFGSLSDTNEERLGSLSLPELKDLGVRLMKASRINDLFEHD